MSTANIVFVLRSDIYDKSNSNDKMILLSYNLTNNELSTLLNLLNNDYFEVEPNTQIYSVDNLNRVAEIYNSLFAHATISAM